MGILEGILLGVVLFRCRVPGVPAARTRSIERKIEAAVKSIQEDELRQHRRRGENWRRKCLD